MHRNVVESKYLRTTANHVVVIQYFVVSCSWDETIGDYYYFNVECGETQWNHPLDQIYRQKVNLTREEFNANPDGFIANAEDHNKEDVTEVSADTSEILSVSKKEKMAEQNKPIKMVRKRTIF
jgi:hypothetical protein